MSKLSITPVTRVTGHLGVKLEVENNAVLEAYCSGTAFRGWEQIISNRNLTDAVQFAQRMCSPCSVGNSIASASAIEDAMQIKVPPNARLVRNILLAVAFMQNHIHHFYRLAMLDFVEGSVEVPLLQGSGADIKIKGTAAAPFMEHYWLADEAYRTASEMIAILGGKSPHPAAIVPGGIAEKLDAQKLMALDARRRQLEDFINKIYLPDVYRLGQVYPEWFTYGKTQGNYLSFGGFSDSEGKALFLPQGYIGGGTFDEINEADITEDSSYTWYEGGKSKPGETEELKLAPLKNQGYTWVKAPRLKGQPAEVGPLARMMIKGVEQVRQLATNANSVMGRHIARAVEARLLVQETSLWLNQLELRKPLSTILQEPIKSSGKAMLEVPSGAMGHWLVCQNEMIKAYNVIAPTTWNASPRDTSEIMGPMEKALVGLPYTDILGPTFVGRVIRSFDPCMDCAVH